MSRPTSRNAPKISDYSDIELISLHLSEQNPLYFNELYRRYSRKVFAKCISMLSDEGQARDATQEIFIKIMLNLARFTELSSFSTWIYSITYNFCIDIIRKRKKMPTIYSDDMGRVSRDTEEVDDIPDSILFEMEEERLKKVLDIIPPGDRAILMMKYAEDLSIKEIGDVLGKTESAIKMQIMRAKHKAQAVYEEEFGKLPIIETN